MKRSGWNVLLCNLPLFFCLFFHEAFRFQSVILIYIWLKINIALHYLILAWTKGNLSSSIFGAKMLPTIFLFCRELMLCCLRWNCLSRSAALRVMLWQSFSVKTLLSSNWRSVAPSSPPFVQSLTWPYRWDWCRYNANVLLWPRDSPDRQE